ncbi:pilus assembly protein PilM [Desulfococcaceae bacterium OttesenSCG-928-F15]|nr:pilus assembly protein PilM [Desulfococcaceae bacterium OttesenSCG-928-F15]
MRFRKANDLVGLDIGSAMVKVAEVSTSSKGKTLKHFGAMALRPEAIEDGIIQDPQHVTDVIHEVFSRNRIRNQNVALSIGGYSAVIKRISMPTMADDALQKNILVEAEQYIPFDINDVSIDYQVIDSGAQAQGSGYMNIMLVAAKKDLIAQYVNVVEAAGLLPSLVDVDAFAIQNIHEAIHGVMPNETILLHVGANKMSMNMVKNGHSVFMRDVSMGSQQINARIRALTGCTDEEAEELKLTGFGKGMSEQNFADIVAQVTGQWCAEVVKAVDFFTSTSPSERVNELVLSGGGAHLERFIEALTMQTGFRVSVLNPFTGVNINPEQFDVNYIQKMAPQAVVAMGLALRKMEDK